MTRRSVMVVALPLLLMAAVTATPSPQIREPDVWQTLESGARKPVAGGRAGLKACPSLCHHTYAPVCGSDGKTYSNLCILQVVSCRNQAITLRHRGKCVFETDQGETRCPGACPFNYAPVCGNDGNTYANPCAFRVSACRNAALRVVANGPCEQMAFPSMRPACPSSCRGEYRPVCGSDGNTYGNQCTLDRVSCRNPSITLAGRGACGTPYGTCPGVCAEVREPVCGSDGVTYQNECVFKAATCMKPSIAFKSTPGECAASQAPQDPCPVLCPAVYKPVCGSDGRTYTNQCVMNSAACNNPSLATASQGECRTFR